MGGYSGGSEKFFSGLLEEGEAGRNDEAEVAPPPLSGHAYTYDGEIRLTRVTNATTSAVALEIEYDALGRRVASTESTGATSDCVSPPVELRHIYLGLATIEEHVDCGAAYDLAREFLWGDNFPEPLVMIDHTNTAGDAYELPSLFIGRGKGRVAPLHDRLGSVIGLTDESGDLVERYTYDPYGKTFIEEPGTGAARDFSVYGNPFAWTGQRYDAGVRLYHFWARSYNPRLGRWLQRDPAGYVDGVSLYEYVAGKPTAYTDLIGLDGVPVGAMPASADNPFGPIDWPGGPNDGDGEDDPDPCGSDGGTGPNITGPSVFVCAGLGCYQQPNTDCYPIAYGVSICVTWIPDFFDILTMAKDIPRGPGGSRKHTPGRDHQKDNHKRDKQDKLRKKNEEKRRAYEKAKEEWNKKSDAVKKLIPELNPDHPNYRPPAEQSWFDEASVSFWGSVHSQNSLVKMSDGQAAGTVVAASVAVVSGGAAIAAAAPAVGAALGSALAPAAASSRALKADIVPVDNGSILNAVSVLPLYRWRYVWESANVQHLGPMADDFNHALTLSGGDDRIYIVDGIGAALAAVQALNEEVEQLRLRVAELEEELEILRKRGRGIANDAAEHCSE